MTYKVLVTTSGIGSRLGDLITHTNKALVRIGRKPAISYIVEAYPKEIPIVVTLGYYAQQIQDFLELAYPDRQFEFVRVAKYKGEGSSLGYSMLQAKNKLQCPFIYHACDTLVIGEIIPEPNTNWVGGFKGDDSTSYASWKVIDKNTIIFNEKGAIEFDYLHIGLIGISEYEKFWLQLKKLYKNDPNNSTLNDGQAITGMLERDSTFRLIPFSSWLDIGNVAALEHARATVPDHFENLDKKDESIFLFDKFVVKFFYDKEIVKKRVERAKILKGLVPEIEGAKENFYKYTFVNGELYSRVVTPDDFKIFLRWSKDNLWIKKESVTPQDFKQHCRYFYYDKTLQRLNRFFDSVGISDEQNIINGKEVPDVKTILSQVDFDELSLADQYRIHGDYILDNIIKTPDSYALLDWRPDFGGLIEVGDIYYDLAKLHHNLHVNHGIINSGQYNINSQDNIIDCDILRRETMVECQSVLYDFLGENDFDIRRVKILTGLIWLNMSPLHHYPFNLFLFYFGKLYLWRAVKET